MVFLWKITQSTTLQLVGEIRNMMAEMNCALEQCKDRSIFLSMFNDIVWKENNSRVTCIANSVSESNYATKFLEGHWSYFGPGVKKCGTERTRCRRNDA